MTNFDINLFYRFDKTFFTLYDNALTKAAKNCDISRQEADILLFLATHPKLDTARDISKYRGLSKAYVSKALDTLVKRGFVSLAVDTQDRRCQHIYLSHHADDIIECLLLAQKQVQDHFFEGLNEEQIQFLFEIMEQLIENNQ